MKFKRPDRSWYCYVCGSVVNGIFYLMTPSDSTDRVFLAHPKCVEQADNPYLMKVQEIKE